eukprot:TRINITY_DN26293_c0_g1_i1.p1 TRINITY_DN26293_c0_g1~~TRINITY_DN26293_c0_g1_i1.p1  ORF type:complete len:664 (-),score=79.30 TRINITY_DN26293_c0_g1_i1:1053-2750(-)
MTLLLLLVALPSSFTVSFVVSEGALSLQIARSTIAQDAGGDQSELHLQESAVETVVITSASSARAAAQATPATATATAAAARPPEGGGVTGSMKTLQASLAEAAFAGTTEETFLLPTEPSQKGSPALAPEQASEPQTGQPQTMEALPEEEPTFAASPLSAGKAADSLTEASLTKSEDTAANELEAAVDGLVFQRAVTEAPTSGAASPTSASPFMVEPYRCGPASRNQVCRPSSKHPCCSPAGWCGISEAHCKCASCLDFRKQKQAKQVATQIQRNADLPDKKLLPPATPVGGEVAKCFAKAITKWPRPWLMIIGDSNMRKTWEFLFAKFKAIADGGEPYAFTNKTKPATGFDPRWFDSDAIFLIKGRPLRISIRFMFNANYRLKTWNGLAETQQGWFNKIFSCGAPDGDWEQAQCPESPHPGAFWHYRWNQGPEFVAITHGLWFLPKAQESIRSACATRRETGRLIKKLLTKEFSLSDGTVYPPASMIWTSNARINGHPKISTTDIEMDRKCQAIAAKQSDLLTLDTYSLVPKTSIQPAGFHFTDTGKQIMLREIISRTAVHCLG